jgi:uracil-DNA glycosylase
MNNSLLFNSNIVHQTWEPFFTSSVIKDLVFIEQKIGNDFTPTHDKVLNFAKSDLNKVKVVILGQDPYPQIGAATGRAFEVNGLNSWDAEYRQASLRNILKLLYKTYIGELINSSQLKKKIAENNFRILPPSKIFKYWEEQGVLLLNIYLTCKVGVPKSHRKIWKEFSRQVIEYITTSNKNIYWFLWGNEAQNEVKNINITHSIASDHPMLCSPKKQTSFINSNCFDVTKNMIDWIGFSYQ